MQTSGYWQLPEDENGQCMPSFPRMLAFTIITNMPTTDANPFNLIISLLKVVLQLYKYIGARNVSKEKLSIRTGHM